MLWSLDFPSTLPPSLALYVSEVREQGQQHARLPPPAPWPGPCLQFCGFTVEYWPGRGQPCHWDTVNIISLKFIYIYIYSPWGLELLTPVVNDTQVGQFISWSTNMSKWEAVKCFDCSGRTEKHYNQSIDQWVEPNSAQYYFDLFLSFMVRSSTTVVGSHVALWKHLLPSLYYNITKLFPISLFKLQSWCQTSGSLIPRATRDVKAAAAAVSFCFFQFVYCFINENTTYKVISVKHKCKYLIIFDDKWKQWIKVIMWHLLN